LRIILRLQAFQPVIDICAIVELVCLIARVYWVNIVQICSELCVWHLTRDGSVHPIQEIDSARGERATGAHESVILENP